MFPWQVGGREMPPDTLSQRYRGKWKARSDTCHAFAGFPCQVGGGMRHLTRFCGKTVPGGRREVTPGTLSQEFRARWKAGRCHLERFRGDSVPGGRQGDATWNAFAEIPYQVGYLSAGTYCGAPPVLPAMRAPSLLGSRCRLRPLYVPVIPHYSNLKFFPRSRYDR